MTTMPRRRWFAYSLRTLFVVVTVFGCWLGYELNWIRERHELLAKHESLHGILGVACNLSPRQQRTKLPTAPGLLGLFGEPSRQLVVLAVVVDRYGQEPIQSFAEWKRAERLFPESEIEGYFISKSDLKNPTGRH